MSTFFVIDHRILQKTLHGRFFSSMPLLSYENVYPIHQKMLLRCQDYLPLEKHRGPLFLQVQIKSIL